MDFENVVRRRRMVRKFKSDPVSEGELERILDFARRGPSAGYTQGQDFVVVRDEIVKLRIAALCGEKHYVEEGFDPFISGAPLLVIPCTNENAYHSRYQEPDKTAADGEEIDWPVPYWFMDGGCAVMLLLLAVVNEGLAAGFAGTWDIDGLKQLLSIPGEVMPLGVIPIGHPAEDKRSPSLKRGRRPISSVVHTESW